MSVITNKAAFNSLHADSRQGYILAAMGMSHIFTLSSRNFNKVKAKIVAGTMPLMTKYTRNTEARTYIEYAMTGVTGCKLTPTQLMRMEWLIDGDANEFKIDKRDNRTFNRASVSNEGIATHAMGLTAHKRSYTLSIKARPLELKKN
tara:strand:+ start:527 stop:967 length:441 start_codon:yes stop_codon:yes gene_type:complete